MQGPYWCIRLTTRAWKNRLYRLPPKEGYHVYIARSTYHYAYARQKQVDWKKKQIKEKKIKESEDKTRKRKKKERKEKKREKKQEKTRQEEEARERKEKKNMSY